MKEPVWLEVSLNGPWSRARQPNIPVSADEIVEAALACAHEGASIIHFHAYDPASGVGLEDAPMGCKFDNRSLVQQARRRIEQAGGALANTSQVRERLRRGTSAGGVIQ